MLENLPYPGEVADQVHREDHLYNLVLLHLDETRPAHSELRRALDALRRTDSSEIWWERRSRVVAAANRALAADMLSALGEPVNERDTTSE
jgi:hypothetical protein